VSISTAVALGALGIGATVASASTTSHGARTSVGHDATTTPDPAQGCARGPGGVVTALTSNSVTVTDPAGTATTFTITSSTTVTKDRRAATIADLAVGDEVRIRPSAAGSTTAAGIDVVQPSVMGKVTAVSGDAITVSGPNTTSTTVIVSSATTYTKDGASATLADVTVGSSIFAEGSFASSSETNVLDATSVGIGVPANPGSNFGHPGGPGPTGAPSGTQSSAVHA
ncbi:MAG TPA: DUF5666 domain-containing protein, partial [Acidimicrobiales bacterium]